MITPEELQEIERLDREATPGPWEASPGADYVVWIKHNEPNRGRFKIACVQSFDRIQENAAFVARARTLLPRLAAAFAEQTATIAALAAGIEAADLRALQAEEALAKAKESGR